MAPQARRAGTAVETEDTLAAIVLADSFTQKLRPVTLERPKVLLPLVNTPMLDYTLEWLAINEVQEVYVFVCAHADQVQEHLRTAGWASSRKFRLHVVVSTNCVSVGEALRVMDGQDAIKSDFVLVAGDVISNMRLAPAVAAHRARRAADKAAILTMVMRGGLTPGHIRRLGDTPTVTVVDPVTHRLLKFEERDGERTPGVGDTTPARRRRKQACLVDAHFFSERDAVQVRTDMVETSIYICAPEVLMLFSDNFDYQNVRRDFVSGVLSEEELGNKLHIYELTDEYAARVNNLRSYDAISRDIIARWVYPFCPDTNLFADADYRFRRGHLYIDSSVKQARTAQISHDSCVGPGTVIEPDAVVESSIIGSNCIIGPGCVLRGAYLFDGVRLQRGVSVHSGLLCDGVMVREGASVLPGAVLSFGAVVDAGVTVPAGSKVSLVKPTIKEGGLASSDDDVEVPARDSAAIVSGATAGGGSFFDVSDDEAQELMLGQPQTLVREAAAALAAGSIPEKVVEFHTDVVGALGAGFVWSERTDSGRHSLALGAAPGLWSGAETAESSDDDVGSVAGDGTTADREVLQSTEPHFKREVSETFLRCVKEKIAHDNVVIELNGLKIAEDKTFADCARYMLTTMLGLCLPAPLSIRSEYRSLYAPASAMPEPGNNKDALLGLLKSAQTQIVRWRPLLHKFLRSEDDQVELLLTLEEFCSAEGDYEHSGEHGSVFAHIFPQMLKILYDLDIVSEEALQQWASEKELAEEQEKVFLRKAQPFLDWLREAEEESEESEDESSADDEA